MSNLEIKRQENKAIIDDLIRTMNYNINDNSELHNQLLIAFSFGIIYAKGFSEKLLAQDIHALTISMLMDVFLYSAEKAGSAANFLITAASDPSFHDTINSIIHRGIDGYEQWKTNDMQMLKENLQKIFIHFS